MKSWIHLSKGQVPRQARVGVGELKEDLLGRQGFFGRAAELYHLRGPTRRTTGTARSDESVWAIVHAGMYPLVTGGVL